MSKQKEVDEKSITETKTFLPDTVVLKITAEQQEHIFRLLAGLSKIPVDLIAISHLIKNKGESGYHLFARIKFPSPAKRLNTKEKLEHDIDTKEASKTPNGGTE